MSGKTYHRILSAVVCVSLLLNSLWGVFLYPQAVFAQEGPSANITFDGLDGLFAGIEGIFTVKVSNVSDISDETFIRYKNTVTKNGSALAGQEVFYPDFGDDPNVRSTWSSFSTDSNGEAYFGPEDGFALSFLPDLKTDVGIETPFAVTLTEGHYSLKVEIVKASDDLAFVQETTEFDINAPQKYIQFTQPSIGVYGGESTTLNLVVEAKYEPHGVDRVRFRYAPPEETCQQQYTHPYFHDLDDGIRNGDTFTQTWDISGLASGEYTICALMHKNGGSEGFIEKNLAKVSVTIDNTSPAIPTGLHILQNGQDLGCGGYVNQRTITIDWDDNTEEDFDHYDYQIREEKTIDQPTVSEKTGDIRDEDGYYKYRVRAVDVVGNASEWPEWCGVTLDRQAPSAVLVFPTPGVSSTSFQVVFSEDIVVSEAEDPANYFLNNWPGIGGSGDLVGDATITYDSGTKTATITFTNLGWYISPEQEWGVQNIHDLAGNLLYPDPTTETSTPMVDPTPPGVPATSPNPTNSTNQSWNWTAATDPGGPDGSGIKGYYSQLYDVDEDSLGVWNWLGNVLGMTTNFDEGVWQLFVKAEDNAGNQSEEVESENLVVDTTAPVIPTGLRFLSADGNTEYQCGDITQRQVSIPVWNEYAGDDFDYYEYSSFHPSGVQGLNEEILYVAKLTNSWMPPTDGAYGFSVRTVDKAGNRSPWSLSAETLEGSCQIIYDTVAPEVTINNPLITNDNTPELTGTYSDTNSVVSIEVSVGGQTHFANINGDDTWTLPNDTLSALTDDLYDVVVEATDEAGNIGTDTTVDELRIDTVAPTATFTHYIDGKEFTGSIAYVNNLNRLTFTGNYSDSIPSSNLKQDSFVIFDAQADGSFRFSANDAKAYCSWRSGANTMPISGTNDTLLNVPFTNCIGSLIEGEYYMTHQVYDNAIRKDIPSITQFRDVLALHFIIDKTAPELSWISPVEKTVISGTTVILSVADDNLSGVDSVAYYYQREGEVDWHEIATLANSPYEYNWDTTGLELGTYNLKAIATDNAGNFVVATRKVDVAAVISGETWNRPEFGKITVSWTTDRATSGRVVYDTTSHSIDLNHPNYGYANTSGVVDSSPKTTNHTVTLSELLNGITYYWRTVSTGSPIVISKEHRGDTFSIPNPPAPPEGEGLVEGAIIGVITTPFVPGEIEGVSVSEEEEEVLGEETDTVTSPEEFEGFGESVLGKSKIIRVILWGGAALGGLILIYFFFRRRKRR
jgi:hypothetical protein